VGLADLFKKAPKLKADPQVRWFGKLPTYADYYASKSDEAWAVEFNDWVLKGYELYTERARAAGAPASKHVPRLPTAACAVRLPRSNMTVFASLLDYGGDMRGRSFPLSFYVGVPTAQWPGPTSDRLAGAGRIMRDLLALRREVPRFLNSPGRFESVFGEREVNLDGVDGQSSDPTWTQEAGKVALADWYTGVNLASDAAGKPSLTAWCHAISLWGANIARHEGDGFEPTLRFPLSPAAGVDVQVAGWVRWLEGRMDLQRRSYSFLVSGEPQDGAARLSVIAHDLIPDDFLLATPLAAALPYVDDACRIGSNSNSASDASEADAPSRPAPAPLATWAEFAISGAATN
jgi:hypothetical protein